MVLLVIDAQKHILNRNLYRFDDFVSNIRILINTARECGTEVIYVRHDDGIGEPLSRGKAGFEIYDDFKPGSGEKIFDKTVNSPFKGTGLLEYLKTAGERSLIVTGLQTDYCIDAAVKCGFEHGFDMFIPEYTNSTFDNEFMSSEESYRYYNEFIWKGRYARCVSLKETVNMLSGRG